MGVMYEAGYEPVKALACSSHARGTFQARYSACRCFEMTPMTLM